MRFRLLIICLFFGHSVFGNTGKTDSLLLEIEKVEKWGAVDQLMPILFDLGLAYYGSEEFNKSVETNQKLLALAQQHDNLEYQGKAFYELGKNYNRLSNYSEALIQYLQSTNYNLDLYESYSTAKAYSRIAEIYRSLGEYEKSYSTEMKALNLAEVKKDSTAIAGCHYNLGTSFFYQKQYPQSLEHYLKAYEIMKDKNNERAQYSCLGALGSIYSELKDYRKAYEFNEKALQLARKLDYQTGIAYSLGNIANQHVAMEEYDQAIDLLVESAQIKKSVGDTWGYIGSQMNLGNIYARHKNNPAKAIPILEECLKLSGQIESKPRRAEIYKDLAHTFRDVGKKEISNEYFVQYVALKDSILNEKTLEEMGQSKRRYEIQKKEHEITLLKKENEILGKDKKIQKLQIYIFAIAGFFLLLFTFWFMNRLKYSKKMNDLLEEKNDLLNSKNDEINNSNKQLELSNKNLSQFAHVASHDLKEPLRMIHSYTSLLKRKYADSFDDMGHEFMYYITDAVGRMQNLLDDLLDFSRAGNRNDNAEMQDLKDVMDIVKANLRHRFEQNMSTLVVRKENLPMIRAQKTQLIQLFQNLVSNGVKFKGDYDPIVEVDCKKEGAEYIFSVKDNGIGISKENREKVFEMFQRLHTTEEFEGTGIGLATCKRIVENLGGKIWLDSEPGKGSTFYFTVPATVEEPVLA